MTESIKTAGRFVAVLLAAWSLSAGTSSATITPEPHLSVRTGLMCSQCHVNRTGGGKRTSFGVIYSQTNLFIKPLRSKSNPSFFDGMLTRTISVGANLRVENVSSFAYENRTGESADFSNGSRIAEANVYVQFDVVPDVVSIYVDQTLSPIAGNREFFGIIQSPRMNSYLKIGRMLLPFGLRLRDDASFIRNQTGYTYNRHDLGIEIGIEPGPYSIITNITDDLGSIIAQTVFRHFRVGGSFSRNWDSADDYVYGAFAGANFGRITVLGEGDFITANGVDQFAGLAEMDVLLRRGLNFKAVYEYFDRNRDVSNSRDGQSRYTFGIEAFVTPFTQVGVYYRRNQFIPQNVPQNQDALMVQFHFFF